MAFFLIPSKRLIAFLIFTFVILCTGTLVQAAEQNKETAIFAGGCFWCVESDFDHVPGVLQTISGYTGGTLENPTYRSVTAGGSGHYEAVEITFDPNIVSYADLLNIFWRSVDPTDDGGQFCDRGDSYKTAIFTRSESQNNLAEISKEEISASGALNKTVATPILPAKTFYPAEDYHQNYYEKNPVRYKYYRFSCGRDAKVEKIWGEQAYQGITDH